MSPIRGTGVLLSVCLLVTAGTGSAAATALYGGAAPLYGGGVESGPTPCIYRDDGYVSAEAVERADRSIQLRLTIKHTFLGIVGCAPSPVTSRLVLVLPDNRVGTAVTYDETVPGLPGTHPIKVTLTHHADDLLQFIFFNETPGSQPGALRYSLSGGVFAKRRRCYDQYADRVLTGASGQFEIDTPVDCSCSVTVTGNAGAAFVGISPPQVIVSGLIRRFIFSYYPDVPRTPRTGSVVLSCGEEVVPLTFIIALGPPRFQTRTKSVASGVRGDE